MLVSLPRQSAAEVMFRGSPEYFSLESNFGPVFWFLAAVKGGRISEIAYDYGVIVVSPLFPCERNYTTNLVEGEPS